MEKRKRLCNVLGKVLREFLNSPDNGALEGHTAWILRMSYASMMYLVMIVNVIRVKRQTKATKASIGMFGITVLMNIDIVLWDSLSLYDIAINVVILILICALIFIAKIKMRRIVIPSLV